MLTRRSAMALLPAGVMLGPKLAGQALAETAVDPIKPDPSAATKILSTLQPYQNGASAPYYDAAVPMIRFAARLGGRTDLTKSPKSELREMLADLKNINDIGNVDHVLTMNKKSEAQLGRGLLSLDDRNRLMSEINGQNDRITQLLDKYFGAGGTLDSNPFNKADRDTLRQLADEILKRGCKLSTWGKDAFYAAMRGYCGFQFVTALLKDSVAPTPTARAYVLGIVADSQSYFAQLTYAASPNTPPPPPQTTPPQTTPSTPPPAESAIEFEKREINRFPKEIYFGSEYGNDTNRCKFDQLANYYGKIDGDFDRGFRITGWSQDCGEVNNRRASAMSGLLSDRFLDFVPQSGNSDNLRVSFERMVEVLNRRVDRIKRQKRDQDNATGAQAPRVDIADTDKADFLVEFTAMERMAWGLREILSKT